MDKATTSWIKRSRRANVDGVSWFFLRTRTILRLNEDLAEAIGLAHDIGHAPFGHQGEHVRTREDAGNPATLEGCIVRLIDKIAYAGKDMRGVYDAKDSDESIVLDFIAGMTDSFAIRSVPDVLIPKMTV